MNTPILTFEKLVTGYKAGRKNREIASRLTASLPKASVTALVGVNGVGKSTLLRTLAGLQDPLDGEIFWEGTSLRKYSPRSLARIVAVVLTERPSAEGLTVREIVEMGRIPYTGLGGRLSEKDHAIVEEALTLTDMSVFSDRMLLSLSDGERQRVMIAKALAQQTPAILLDEPTAFLDFPGKVDVLQLLCRLAEEYGKTILLSTHDLELTLRMVSRLWLLSSDGITEGTPRELAEDGSIGRFFSTDGVAFNSASMRFDVKDNGLRGKV